MKKVLIIGAGIGGLHTGIHLAYAGFDVTIFEKNDFPGGVVHSVALPGKDYLFDATASIMLSPSAYGEIFSHCGTNPDDYFTAIPLEETYQVFTTSSAPITFPTSFLALEKMLTSTFPTGLLDYFHVLEEVSKRFAIADQTILTASFVSKAQLCSAKFLFQTYSLHTLGSAASYVDSSFGDEILRDFFLFQTMFMGGSPLKIPSIYTAIPVVTQLEGLSHVKGGMGNYTAALSRLFEELGGKLYLGHPVKKVLFQQSTAIGVEVGEQYIRGDSIIIGADYRYAYQKLFPQYIQHHLMSTHHFAQLKGSIGVFILRLVVRQPLVLLKVHNLIIPQHFMQAIAETFSGKIPTELPVYVYYPSAIDSSFQSADGPCLHMMVRVPNLLDLPHWNPAIIEKLTQNCIKLLSETTQLPDLKDSIAYTEAITPTTFEEMYHYFDGSAFGLAPTFSQSMAFRPQFMNPKVKDLYFVGNSIHPGNGVSIVMKGAKILSDYLIQSSS